MGRQRQNARSRRRVTRRGRTRCRECGIRESARYCPGVNANICPVCCNRMRPNLSACMTCKYYTSTIPMSRELPEPDTKYYGSYVSDSEKSGLLILALGFTKPDGRLKVMIFLLDFWKSGLKDCFVDTDMSKEEFEQRFSIISERPSKKISLNDAKALIQRGLYISNAVGTPIPWDYQRWKYLLGDMSNVPNPTGSLYKCSRCGAELSDALVELIKSHSQSEDVRFYIVCGKCAGEFED